MHVPIVQRQGGYGSPTSIIAAALALAVLAMLLVRPGSSAARYGEWSAGGAAPSAPLLVVNAAAVAQPPAAPPAPIRARVGLQVGHWQSEAMPDELAALRTQTGAKAGGYNEVEVNLALARQVAALLAARGITVDLLPATIPVGYTADAFIAIHCDYNTDPGMAGFKLARFRSSTSPASDDALLGAITTAYGAATGQQRDSHITRAMTGYYAFNSEDFRHTIAPGTPGVIIELGFLTNDADRALLVGQQPTVAGGLAAGIIRFLIGE